MSLQYPVKYNNILSVVFNQSDWKAKDRTAMMSDIENCAFVNETNFFLYSNYFISLSVTTLNNCAKIIFTDYLFDLTENIQSFITNARI